MKRIVRLTESDLARIVKRVIKENTQKYYLNEEINYYVEYRLVYEPVNSPGMGFDNEQGTVWLNSEGFNSWPLGDANRAKISANKLANAIEGLDITGEGRKKMLEVEKEWKNFDLKTQNEFLKEWGKISTKKGWNSFIPEIINDNENDIADRMITDSENKIKALCSPLTIKKSKGEKIGPICDSFVRPIISSKYR